MAKIRQIWRTVVGGQGTTGATGDVSDNEFVSKLIHNGLRCSDKYFILTHTTHTSYLPNIDDSEASNILLMYPTYTMLFRINI